MKLIDYIKGQRHGKDAHRLEREAMQDPFLSDAIDGFDTVNGRHVERIDEIRQRLSQRTLRTNNSWFAYVGIAASLVVLLTIGGYYLFMDKPDHFIAKNEEAVSEMYINKPTNEESVPLEAESEADESKQDVKAGYQDLAANVQRQSGSEYTSTEDADIAEVVPPVLSEYEKQSSQVVNAEAEVLRETHTADMDATKEQGQKSVGSEHDAEQPLIAQVDESMDESVADKKDIQELKKPAPAGSAATRAITRQERKQPAKLETPEPKIGWKAYKSYLKNSLRRPAEGECVKSKGIVEVTFHIDEDGVPYDFVIGKSLCPDSDAEAIRLVKEGSVWTCKSFRRMTIEVKF